MRFWGCEVTHFYHILEGKNMGVIDALTEGFNIISKRVWLVLLPVLLDLVLWLGPQLSLVPLLQQRPELSDAPPDLVRMMQSLEQVRLSAVKLAEGFNLFSVLALFAPQTLGVPSLVAGGLPPKSFVQYSWVIAIRSNVAFYGWTFLLLVMGTLIGCLYWGLIAQQVRDGHADLRLLWRRAPVWWGKLVVFGFLLLAVSLLLLFPVLLVVGFLAIISQELAFVALGLLAALLLWLVVLLSLYGFFFTAALIIDDQGILRAIRSSILVAHRNFWSTLGLILLINVIMVGLTLIWRSLIGSLWGTLFGIAGNAYAGSALIAASLSFYHARREQGRQPKQEVSR
jgi:hypothetical protein